MNTDGQRDSGLLSEAVRQPQSKPALGPPHDTYATLILTLAVAAALFFTGRVYGVGDALGWVGMLTSLAVVIADVFYFQRAYGFASRGWGTVPVGARAAVIFGFIYTQQFVPAAIYEQYFHESLLAYSLICLALAMLPTSVLRATLGKASAHERAERPAPRNRTSDAKMPSAVEERG